eukprot:12907061-Prorocentrum_lima.AAC.1
MQRLAALENQRQSSRSPRLRPEQPPTSIRRQCNLSYTRWRTSNTGAAHEPLASTRAGGLRGRGGA